MMTAATGRVDLLLRVSSRDILIDKQLRDRSADQGRSPLNQDALVFLQAAFLLCLILDDVL